MIRWSTTFLLLFAILQFAPFICAHDNLRRADSFRVLEDAAVISRCLEKTLEAPKDPQAEFRQPPPGIHMKAFDTVVYIPIVFHVCRKVGATAGNVPVDSLRKGLNLVNEAYAGIPDIKGVKQDTNVRFFLQGIVYWDNDEYFMNCEGLDGAMKAKTAINQDSVINVYTCRLSVLGFAYLPWVNTVLHGVVLNFMTFPGNSQEDPYYFPYKDFNKAYTLVHEIGHALGLIHTFEGGCSGSDASDTTPEARPFYGTCDPLRPELVAPDTCQGGGADPISNFMDYSMDACMRSFTPGQINRMQTELAKYKPTMAFMTNSLRCYANGVTGTAHKYGVCNESLPLTSTMPNGNLAPASGWCYTVGFPQRWGTTCCPGSCPDFEEVAPFFPPLGESKTIPTASPTQGSSVVAVLDKTCKKSITWAAANKACKKKKMRLCTSADIKAGVLASAIIARPACGPLQNRILWTGLGCGGKAAVSIAVKGNRELCDRRARKYAAPCCKDVPAAVPIRL